MLAGHPPGRDEAARLLGVSPMADEATVRRAFRAWVGIAHPDHGGDPRHFSAICAARDALLEPYLSSPAAPAITPRPRTPWRQVLRRPAPVVLVLLVFGFAASAAAVLLAGRQVLPWGAVPAALASAAWCVAVSRVVLRGADHGHVIVTRSAAWTATTAAQGLLAVVAGVSLIEALPLLAVPFVAVIATVNPAAGLRRSGSR